MAQRRMGFRSPLLGSPASRVRSGGRTRFRNGPLGPLLAIGFAAFVALDVLLVLRLTRSEPAISIDDLPAAVIDQGAASERDPNVGNAPELGATTITENVKAEQNEGGAIDQKGDKPRAAEASESGSSDTGSGTSAPADTSTSDPGSSNPGASGSDDQTGSSDPGGDPGSSDPDEGDTGDDSGGGGGPGGDSDGGDTGGDTGDDSGGGPGGGGG